MAYTRIHRSNDPRSSMFHLHNAHRIMHTRPNSVVGSRLSPTCLCQCSPVSGCRLVSRACPARTCCGSSPGSSSLQGRQERCTALRYVRPLWLACEWARHIKKASSALCAPRLDGVFVKFLIRVVLKSASVSVSLSSSSSTDFVFFIRCRGRTLRHLIDSLY